MTIHAHLHRLAAVLLVGCIVIAFAVAVAVDLSGADAPSPAPAQQPQATVAWLAQQGR